MLHDFSISYHDDMPTHSFQILKRDKKTKARLGLLKTAHGTVKTPAYVFVGTYGKIRHLSPTDIKKTGAQLIISNTFHLQEKTLNPKHEIRKKSKIKNSNNKTLLTEGLGQIPTMTDSGGFQVLSLAFSDKAKVGKFMIGEALLDQSYKRTKVKISSKGVKFFYNDEWKFLGPELSMKIQEKIGADIIFAFDHITSPLDNYEYNKKAVELTDRWAKVCLESRSKNQEARQMIYGIVQGGLFKNLRIKSAKSIGAMPFDGFGIGGSYTKKQIAQILKWIIPNLPEEKPRHLLGVGKVDDVFEAIENGVDTFDCVIPTREARHGRLYTRRGTTQIQRGIYAEDKRPIEIGCKCPTCLKRIPRSKIRELIKSDNRKLNAKGQRWCLMHNMCFFNNLLENIRAALSRGTYTSFKNKFLANFTRVPLVIRRR